MIGRMEEKYMENMSNTVPWWDKMIKIAADIGYFIARLFGGFDIVLIVLVACMIIDHVCSLIVSWLGRSPKSDNERLDGRTSAVGIAKKGLILLVVLMGALLDRALGTDVAVFRNAIVWFYIANEGLSILKKTQSSGSPLS